MRVTGFSLRYLSGPGWLRSEKKLPSVPSSKLLQAFFLEDPRTILRLHKNVTTTPAIRKILAGVYAVQPCFNQALQHHCGHGAVLV